MDIGAYGVVEIALVFGAVLAWAAWEIRSNRRALTKSRERR